MKFSDFLAKDGEQPLDNMVTNGGFVGIFRTIACVGDSLASGEFESFMDGKRNYHDYYDYSWGKYISRDAGCTVYNFSKGGMNARNYCNFFASENNFWSPTLRAQAYIIALGVNDMNDVKSGVTEFGEMSDIDFENCNNNKDTFVGNYAKIIQRYREISPYAKFFLMTTPPEPTDPNCALYDKHAEVLRELATLFDNTYVLDFRKYAPVYDEEYSKNFRLGYHLNPMGYRLTALMVESYIDYIIRHNMQDFKQVGFIGTDYYFEGEKR